jgi:hypothetical protein
MTTYPPFEALRACIREARAHRQFEISPALAKPRFYVMAETILGPMLRHAAHILWLEGVPASAIIELDSDPPHVAIRMDDRAMGVYFWPSSDSDSVQWAVQSSGEYGQIHTVAYHALPPSRLASLLERTIEELFLQAVKGQQSSTGEHNCVRAI